MNKIQEQKILINRIFLFSFALVATPISIFIFWASDSFSINSLFVILMYFTIWSNIFVFIWSGLSLINIRKKSEKINKILEHWFIKTTITLFIFLTGIVLNFILIPWEIVLHEIGDANVPNPNGLNFYTNLIIAILGASLFQHVLVPIFMVRDFFLTKGANIKEETSKFSLVKKTVISLIAPIIWFILSLIFIGTGILEPQYPFMHFFDTKGWELGINIIIILLICLSWIVLFYQMLVYSNKNNITN